MNLEKLQIAQQDFFLAYPEGFSDPKMQAIGKKHKMPQMIEFAQEQFSEEKFVQPDKILEHWVKLVSRSSMVSLFEKPKFRDFVKSLSQSEKETLTQGLSQFLHGDQATGFKQQIALMKQYKLAKWSLFSILPAYYAPDTEVFVKPTTVKGIIKHFELAELEYKPTPSWEFYKMYRERIQTMKSFVPDELSPNTAAFSGFLMMSLPSWWSNLVNSIDFLKTT